MTEKEKMIAGLMYDASDRVLREKRTEVASFLATLEPAGTNKERGEKLRHLMGTTGDEFYVTAGFIFEYGFNIHVGENFYCNFNCTLLDICPITIGDNCMLAPNVQLYTATHPIDPVERNSGLEYGKPITLGNSVWIGGGAIIVPGVTLGDNVVVAAGSVVTKSFGDNVVIAGNPAKVIKEIEL